MTLVKFRPARRMIRGYNPLFSDFVSRAVNLESERDNSWSPRVDIIDGEKNIEIRAELPGINKSEIGITFKDDILTIKGERKSENSEGKESDNYFYRESRYGSFERSFKMNVPVEDEKIKAKYKNGIMTVSIPKAAVPEPKKIEIK